MKYQGWTCLLQTGVGDTCYVTYMRHGRYRHMLKRAMLKALVSVVLVLLIVDTVLVGPVMPVRPTIGAVQAKENS